MKRINYLYILFAFLFSCSGINKVTKMAFTFEQEGMYKQASEYYINALDIKRNHIDASIGLKRTSQKVLDDYLEDFFKVHTSNDHKNAVYTYLKAIDWKNKILRYNISLNTPDYYLSYYNEDLDSYLNDLYEKAQRSLDKEEFYSANNTLSEIISLNPDFKDAKNLKELSYSEPIYRKGNDAFESGKYRKAYYLFKQITSYKDSDELFEYSLEKAQFPIAIMPFENGSTTLNAHKAFQAQFTQTFIQNKDPFITVTDRSHIETILAEQELGISGLVDYQTAAKAGDLLGVKGLLTGTVVSLDITENKITRTRKKGWERYIEIEKKVHKKTGKVIPLPIPKYKKVYYNSFYGRNIVSISIEYKLISTETGEILANNLIFKKYDVDVNYCTYDGEDVNLYEGNWNDMNSDSSIDNRKNNRSKIKRLLKANRNLPSISDMKNSALKTVCSQAVNEINSYNPEED